MIYNINKIIYFIKLILKDITIKYNTRTRDTNIRHNNKHDKLIS